MILVDHHDTHPACDLSDPDAARIRAEAEAQWRGLKAAQLGQQQAVTAAPDDHAAALEHIRAAAVSMPELWEVEPL